MVEIQVILYVRQQGLSPSPNEVRGLSTRYDLLRCVRINWHCSTDKYVHAHCPSCQCLTSATEYVDQQDDIERLHSSASVHNDDFVGIASYNIFVGIAVATIFGAAFFFDLFFPTRYEPMNIRWAWRISAVVVTSMAFADAIAFTVITATGNAWVSANSVDAAQIALEQLNPPLTYRQNGKAIASVVLLWVGLVATIARSV
jgi:hypothetical protein